MRRIVVGVVASIWVTTAFLLIGASLLPAVGLGVLAGATFAALVFFDR